MIPDPYAMMEHAFGMEVKGLLQDGEHYSDYWNQRGASEAVGMRSPLTWRSEVNPLKFVVNEKTVRPFVFRPLMRTFARYI